MKTLRTKTIEEVPSYWNSRPCNIRHSSKEIGSKEYFDEVEHRKYIVEPHNGLRENEKENSGHWRDRFLGSNLCIRLVNEGNSVISVDNNYTGSFENVASITNNPDFRFIEHDVIEYLEVDGKIDQIYNMACPASPPAYQGKHAVQTTKTSVYGAVNMLELAKAHNARILQTSTSEIYGEPLEHPQTETYRGNVNSIGIRACYDEGKRCAESLFFDYYRNEVVDIKVVRIFNTYGSGMNPDDGRVVSNFIIQALQGEDITLYGEGNQTCSFCYVDDLILPVINTMSVQLML